MAGLGFDDAAPRVISAKTHGIIDYVHVATNLLAGILFRRHNKAASNAAFALAGGVLFNTLSTDYQAGLFRLYSFRVHGMQDYGAAGACLAIPALLGFADEPASIYFYIQGAGESVIAALTDYNDNSGAQHARLTEVTPFSASRAA